MNAAVCSTTISRRLITDQSGQIDAAELFPYLHAGFGISHDDANNSATSRYRQQWDKSIFYEEFIQGLSNINKFWQTCLLGVRLRTTCHPQPCTVDGERHER
jgi:hypothetical protein